MWVEFQSSEESCAPFNLRGLYIHFPAPSANNYSFLLYLCVLVAVVIKRVQFIYIAPLTNRNFLLAVTGLTACRSSRKYYNGMLTLMNRLPLTDYFNAKPVVPISMHWVIRDTKSMRNHMTEKLIKSRLAGEYPYKNLNF